MVDVLACMAGVEQEYGTRSPRVMDSLQMLQVNCRRVNLDTSSRNNRSHCISFRGNFESMISTSL